MFQLKIIYSKICRLLDERFRIERGGEGDEEDGLSADPPPGGKSQVNSGIAHDICLDKKRS